MSETITRGADYAAIKRGPILFALIVGSVVSLLNETLINVALTAFMREFDVSATSAQWLSTGFMLITGILVPVTAFALEWISTKALFLGSLAIFSCGTAIAGSAASFPMLLVGRFIQAIGTGPMVPLMVNTALQITEPKKHGSAMGLCMLVTLTAPAIAPTIAGFVIEFASWRWMFFGLIPFALLSCILAVRYLNVPRELSSPKLDLASVMLSTAGFGSFIYGISEAGSAGIALAALPLAVGAACLGLFVWRELSIETPMLNLMPFKNAQFSLGMGLVFIQMMGAFAGLLLLPIYFQSALAITPLFAGLAMLPGGLVNGLFAPVAGKLYDALGPRRIVPMGLGVMTAGLAALALVVRSGGSPVPALAIYTLMMVGLSCAFTPVQTNSLSCLSREMIPHGTAIMNTLQMIGAAFGSSLFIGIMAARQATLLAIGKTPRTAVGSGLRHSFFVCALIFGAAFLASLGIRENKRNGARHENARA